MDLSEVYDLFPTEADCIAHIEQARWGGIPTCPYCQSEKTTPLPLELRHHCNSCKTSFSVTVGTVFHHTRLPLQKWFLAIYLTLGETEKNISIRQLSRHLRVNKDTAWRIVTRIKDTLTQYQQEKLLAGIMR